MRSLVVALFVLLCATAHAEATSITYAGFSSSAGLTLAGQATTVLSADGTVLRLTPAQPGKHGAAYTTQAVALGAAGSFQTTFEFRINASGTRGPGEGMAFVLAADPATLGSSWGPGSGLGYIGTEDSMAIEFDTLANKTAVDTTSNHVAIDLDGIISDAYLSNAYGVASCGAGQNNVSGCMSNGDVWRVVIGYNGTGLSVSAWDMSGAYAAASPYTVFSNVPLDLGSALGSNEAYVGFTAATSGSGYETHDIVNWQFSSNSGGGSAAMPEPSSVVLLASGLVAAFVLKRVLPSN